MPLWVLLAVIAASRSLVSPPPRAVVPEGRGRIQPSYVLPLSLQPEPPNLPIFKSSSAFRALGLPPPAGKGKAPYHVPPCFGGTLTQSQGKC